MENAQPENPLAAHINNFIGILADLPATGQQIAAYHRTLENIARVDLPTAARTAAYDLQQASSMSARRLRGHIEAAFLGLFWQMDQQEAAPILDELRFLRDTHPAAYDLLCEQALNGLFPPHPDAKSARTGALLVPTR